MLPSPDLALREGIAAVHAGDLARARSLLLPLVQADEHHIQAWYWLSRAVESPDEREICLENVLALDPGHRGVQAELADLRRARAEPQQPESSTLAALGQNAAPVVPATPEEILVSDAATEPLPCPYCGTVTAPLDRACAACGRPLWQRERKTKAHSAYSVALVFGWLLLANYAWFSVCMAVLGASLAAGLKASPGLLGVVNGVAPFFGTRSGLVLPDLPLLPILAAGGAAFAFALIVAAGLAVRSPFFYWLTVGLIVLAAMPALIVAATAEHLPLLRLAIGLVLFIGTMSLVFMAHDEYAWRGRRLAAILDPDVDSDSALYDRGRRYAGQGMWARAAVHWSKAVALNPSQPDYRLALATACINLNQSDRAGEHLDAARRLDPSDPRLRDLAQRLS